MSKILVGRDNKEEVEVGFTMPIVAPEEKEEVSDGQAQEELVETVVEDEPLVAPEESDVSEAQEAAPKRRGKKRGKA